MTLVEMAGTRARRLAFRAKAAIGSRSSRETFAALLSSQYAAPDVLKAAQNESAAAIGRFAMAESPFYRQFYADHGVTPEVLDDPDGWTAVPIVDRTMLREHRLRVQTPQFGPDTTEQRHTGGSTGEPLVTALDKRFPHRALVWRMYRWWGIEPYDNLAHLSVWKPTRRQKTLYDARWWPTRHVWAHPGLLSPQVMTAFVTDMQATKSVLLDGYVGAVAEIGDFMVQQGVTVPSLRAVAVTAAPLTPGVRAHIGDSFATPVYDQYRCSEVPFLAAECRQRRGHHVFAEHRRLEIVGDDGQPVPDGTEGHVVVTDLANRVFPIIRYRLGDRGRYLPGSCPCGVTLPLLESPKGRLSSVLRLPDGTLMGAGLAGLFAEIPDAVRQFKIHQRADYSIHISVILGSSSTAREQVERVVDRLRATAQRQVPVEVDYVESIAHERGKIRFVVSDVPGTG
jgi:phenylacetate-CoA ligase